MTPDIQTLIDALADPVLIVGNDGRIAHLNTRAETVLGKGFSGRRVGLALRQPAAITLIETALDGGAGGSARVLLSVERHRTRPHDVRVVPFELDRRRVLLVTLDDVHEREESDRRRQDFVADVSHELKTPLTAMRGLVETLTGPASEEPETRRRFLGLLLSEVGRMERLVGDLLTLQRVEAGAGRARHAEIALPAVVADAVRALRPLADKAGVSLVEHAARDLPPIIADEDQVRQVALNLISNALHHSGATGIEVSASAIAKDPVLSGPAVALRVKDDGRGIEDHHIPRLTERFYRVESHRARNETSGTGLGLAIVKHILARHGGRLVIDSAPGKGARFDAIFPASPVDTKL